MSTTLVFFLWIKAGASIKVIRDKDYISFENCQIIAEQTIQAWKGRIPKDGGISWKCEQRT